jgi:hypothetical protein
MVRQDFNIKKNATWDWYFIVKDDDTLEVVDITGYTATLQAREERGTGSAVIDLSVGSGITITGASGKVAIEMTPVQTAALTFESAWYDLLLTDTASKVDRVLEGKLKLTLGGH